MPVTVSKKYIYADDLALLRCDNEFKFIETVLSTDLDILRDYFRKWRLKLNINKTVCSTFYTSNRLADYELTVTTKGIKIPFEKTPKYLGATLDRTLSFKQHAILQRKLYYNLYQQHSCKSYVVSNRQTSVGENSHAWPDQHQYTNTAWKTRWTSTNYRQDATSIGDNGSFWTAYALAMVTTAASCIESASGIMRNAHVAKLKPNSTFLCTLG